jgi:hypothetical protein
MAAAVGVAVQVLVFAGVLVLIVQMARLPR